MSILPLGLAGAIVLGLVARPQSQTQPPAKPQAAPPTQAQTCPGQDVATHQTANAFSSINDGQPGTPRQPQVTVVPSYDFGERQYQLSIQNVFARSGFWCQAFFGINAPTLRRGDSLMDFEHSATLSWLQRWHTDNGETPTFSTIVGLKHPYDEPDTETELILAGIVVKSISWGAVYLNVFAKMSGTMEIENFTYGGVVGVKRIIRQDFAVFADIVIEDQGAYALEFSVQRDLKNGWTLGPGVSLQRNGIGGDDFGAVVGINIAKVFGG